MCLGAPPWASSSIEDMEVSRLWTDIGLLLRPLGPGPP